MMFNLFKSNMTLKRILIAGKQLKTLLRDKKNDNNMHPLVIDNSAINRKHYTEAAFFRLVYAADVI